MKNQKIILVFTLILGISLHGQDKEWFSSIPGDPTLKNSHLGNSISFQTQNYLCRQGNDSLSVLYFYNGIKWKRLKVDSLTSSLQSMDEQNDSIAFLAYTYSSVDKYVWFYDGNQWKKITKLKGANSSLLNGISSIKFYRNKLYAIFLNNHLNSSLMEYDFKTNTIKTVTTFQQIALNNVYSDYDKLAMNVSNGRLYISGAYDSANHKASQGYGYYDGTSFKSINIFPISPINYSLVKPLDNNIFVVQRFYTVTTNDISTNRMFLIRNDSIISDITSNLYKKYFSFTGLAYSNHSFFQVYMRNGDIHFFTQVTGEHYAFEPESRRWHNTDEFFWDGYSFYFKNNRYLFNSKATLPYTTPSLACFILKPKSYISGLAYADMDDNCTYTSSDQSIPYQWMKLEGKNNTTATLSNYFGNYEMPIEPDQYTFAPYESAYSNTICSTGTIKVDTAKVYKRDVSHTFIAPYKSTGDIKVSISSNALRRGFNHGVNITLENAGKPDLTVRPRLKFDQRIQFLSSNFSYSFADQHTIVFDPIKVNKFKPIQIDLIFFASQDSLSNSDKISFTASADSSNTEVRYDNNIARYTEMVRGPYDPNKISSNPEGLITNSPKTINYMVEFQNLGTDTAFNVSILDTIPSSLDIYSIKILSSSSKSISANIKGSVVSFKLNQIRLTTKLINEANSKGFISFSINLKDSIQLGQVIKNKVGIYFDYEAEVATNQSVVERLKNSLAIQPINYQNALPFTVYPNPSTHHISLRTNTAQAIESMQFYSSTGQALLAETTNNLDFDISQWPSGLFIMVVKMNGQVYTWMGSKVAH